MIYRSFGTTGVSISALGFGAMRLPECEVNGEKTLDKDAAVALLQKGYELGINYVDSAYFYHNGQSELAVGESLKGWRDRVNLSTKSPGHLVLKPGDYRRILEEQLKKLQVETVDFYHFHGISYDGFWEVDRRSGWLEDARRAKEEGLIRNISFSFHAPAEDLIKLVDTGIFASVLCQYNLIDRTNADAMSYARSKGLGVVVMGPVGGGRILGLPERWRSELGLSVEDNAEMALKFVLANRNVDCVLSGMGSTEMLVKNAGYASDPTPLTEREVDVLETLMKKLRGMADLYCTGCKYCQPCPEGVDIPVIFDLLNHYRVFELTEHARNTYGSFGKEPWLPKVKADACTECGACESRCPQRISIREQLKEAHRLLG